MKSPIIAAALLAGAIPFVHAQSSVVLYGVADAGLVYESGGSAGHVNAVSSGVASGNRIGFKGKEDLGGGMAAFFQLENGYNIDTGTAGQGGLLFGRQAFVGLSGAAGAVSLGRQYSPYYKVMRDVVDPFGIGLAGNSLNIMVGNTRVDNMVEYQSPRYLGWSVDVAYGAGEAPGNGARNRSLGTGLAYTQGRFGAHLVHHRRENATASDHASNTLLAVKYDFGVVVASLAHARNQGLAGADSRDTLLGLTVPLGGAHKVLASVIVHRDGAPAARDARQWAAAYLYGLSKRTDLYAAYGHIDNSNGAAFRVGNATDAGSGDTAFNLGVRHTF
ncbi:porin [Pseudoduganella namucuonensis]|uniref:Outer membrane protein (Porin) n=1 Tax=Pseudoduganella namucuonensis TaxID=1035707 RepID=A0A1I7F423_9BURK|nr:porin [Pseudoduganella namucuonensis]SFU30870.1 Outer membrane protein (porin) [Pseudoduganella namucuonensis]